MAEAKITHEELAVRSHDIVACMERARSPDFETLATLGIAVKLALHLRGAPPMAYEDLKLVATHVLNVAPAEARPALELLEEAEFVKLVGTGKTIKTVVPFVPYFDELYTTLGEVGETQGLTELEEFTVTLARKLAVSPLARDSAFGLGAEATLVDKALVIGTDGGFMINHRARGRDILISPSYFPDHPDAFVDLVAAKGSSAVGRVFDLLRSNQGMPLSVIEDTSELGGTRLTDEEIAIIRALAREGFAPPPAIETTHAGSNFFIFGPRPGVPRLPLHKRNIYERAMALVASVRQGQFLPAKYKIWSPSAVLAKLQSIGHVRANSEAWEQYRQVATMGIARLEPVGDRFRLVLIDQPENKEALAMAIALVTDGEVPCGIDEQAVLAFGAGHNYVESLVGRKRLVDQPVLQLSKEARADIDALLFRRFK